MDDPIDRSPGRDRHEQELDAARDGLDRQIHELARLEAYGGGESGPILDARPE